MKEIFTNIWNTKGFIAARLSVSMLLSLLYILLAAMIQYWFVEFFGHTTFNYIMGAVISLMCGAFFLSYVGRLLFMVLRGANMAALAYVPVIKKKHLSSVDAGMKVFTKHFTSFAIIYGTSAVLKKFIDSGANKLWELLKDVPFLGSLQKISHIPIVQAVARDILDTAFDAAVFYCVKYTKPGFLDDVRGIATALRIYLYALPRIMATSIIEFVASYIVPKFIKWSIITTTIAANGIVDGLYMWVLLTPILFIISQTVFEPIRTAIYISAFSSMCTEEMVKEATSVDEEASINEPRKSFYHSIIDNILQECGLMDVFEAEDDSSDVYEDGEKEEGSEHSSNTEERVRNFDTGSGNTVTSKTVRDEDKINTTEDLFKLLGSASSASSGSGNGLAELIGRSAPAKPSGKNFQIHVDDFPLEDLDDDGEFDDSSVDLESQLDMLSGGNDFSSLLGEGEDLVSKLQNRDLDSEKPPVMRLMGGDAYGDLLDDFEDDPLDFS